MIHKIEFTVKDKVDIQEIRIELKLNNKNEIKSYLIAKGYKVDEIISEYVVERDEISS